jgi:hypothetical protein
VGSRFSRIPETTMTAKHTINHEAHEAHEESLRGIPLQPDSRNHDDREAHDQPRSARRPRRKDARFVPFVVKLFVPFVPFVVKTFVSFAPFVVKALRGLRGCPSWLRQCQ